MSRDFESGLDEYMRLFIDGAEEGLALAGMQALTDSVMGMPMVPLDEGTLKGSGSVFVSGKLVGTSEHFAQSNPKAKPTPATEFAEQLASDQLKATIGFNTPYAAKMHEGTEFEFQHSGHGAKYLEDKLATNSNDYMQIVADSVERKVRGARAA